MITTATEILYGCRYPANVLIDLLKSFGFSIAAITAPGPPRPIGPGRFWDCDDRSLTTSPVAAQHPDASLNSVLPPIAVTMRFPDRPSSHPSTDRAFPGTPACRSRARECLTRA